jgi:glucose uptake protein
MAWGSIGFVSNKIGGDAKQQTLGMTFGAFVFAAIVFAVVRPPLSLPVFVIGFVGGLIWSAGQSGQFHAMKYLGVSVASPISSGGQLVFGGLIGVFVFHEWTKPIQFALGFSAMVLLLIGFYFSAKRDPANTAGLPEQHEPVRGMIALAYSTLGYVFYLLLFNNLSALWFHLTFTTLTILLPMSLGMIVGAWLLAGGRVKMGAAVAKNIPVGLMWGVGNVFFLLSARAGGLAIAFTFSQLGIVISIFGGILFLGEKKTRLEMRYVWLGVVLFIVGAIMLGIVKAQ